MCTGQLSLLPGWVSEQERALLAFAAAHHLQGRVDLRAQLELGVSPTRYYQLLSRLVERPEVADAAPVLVRQLRELRGRRREQRARRSLPTPALAPGAVPLVAGPVDGGPAR